MDSWRHNLAQKLLADVANAPENVAKFIRHQDCLTVSREGNAGRLFRQFSSNMRVDQH